MPGKAMIAKYYKDSNGTMERGYYHRDAFSDQTLCAYILGFGGALRPLLQSRTFFLGLKTPRLKSRQNWYVVRLVVDML